MYTREAHYTTLLQLINQMAENQENYIRTLQAEIEQTKQDRDALRAELTKSGGAEIEKPAQVVKQALMPNVPQYIANIDALAQAADSESVKLQANKLLVEWTVTDKLIVGDGEADAELKTLLQKLAKKTKTT